VPVLPRIDMLEHGRITHIQEFPLYNANWIQLVENNLDGSHIYVLHQDTLGVKKPVPSTTRGHLDQLKAFDYWECPFGIMRHQEMADGYVEDDPLIFPNTLRRMNQLVINIPMDDTHCFKFDVFVEEREQAAIGANGHGADDHIIEHYVLTNEGAKLPPDEHHLYARHRMDRLRLQDFMVVETQGAISPRESWRLGTSDRGIALFWDVLAREVEKVAQGLDPIGVIRDPAQAYLDTKFDVAHDLAARSAWPDGVLVYPKR
jgi:5,5'-dehydrodivanillate O-demethylase